MNKGLSDRQIAKRLKIKRKEVTDHKNEVYFDLMKEFPIVSNLVMLLDEFNHRWLNGEMCPHCNGKDIIFQRIQSPKAQHSVFTNINFDFYFYGCKSCKKAEMLNVPSF